MDPKMRDFDGVYYPREDSFLLEEAVKKYAKGKVLDLGTGSGVQGIAAAMKGCTVTFSDIDWKAIDAARQNAKANGADGTFIVSDLFSNIEGSFDTIIFNPPYLPSEGRNLLALDGGSGGREVIEKFLKGYKSHLNPGGIVLLLESTFSGYQKEVDAGAKVLSKAHYSFEDLVVLELR